MAARAAVAWAGEWVSPPALRDCTMACAACNHHVPGCQQGIGVPSRGRSQASLMCPCSSLGCLAPQSTPAPRANLVGWRVAALHGTITLPPIPARTLTVQRRLSGGHLASSC